MQQKVISVPGFSCPYSALVTANRRGCGKLSREEFGDPGFQKVSSSVTAIPIAIKDTERSSILDNAAPCTRVSVREDDRGYTRKREDEQRCSPTVSAQSEDEDAPLGPIGTTV